MGRALSSTQGSIHPSGGREPSSICGAGDTVQRRLWAVGKALSCVGLESGMRLGGKDTLQSARHHPLQAKGRPPAEAAPLTGEPLPFSAFPNQHTQLGRAHPQSTCLRLGSLLARQENPPTGAPLTTRLRVSAFREG